MGFNDYILTCEKENKELEKDLEYYKNQNIRLKTENKKYEEVIDKAIKYANNHINQETFDGYMDSYELKKLLDILKEVSE